jgi:hypothetical protein
MAQSNHIGPVFLAYFPNVGYQNVSLTLHNLR